MFRWLIVLAVTAAGIVTGGSPPPIVECPCDHSRPETLNARVCSLCETAEEQETEVYFLKDINPHKPNRHLALPKEHDRGLQSIGTLPAGLRVKVWKQGIAKARSLFGERWGMASNSHFFRTQCHAHIHMGPLSPEVEDVGGQLYDRPEDFPVVGPEQGMWVHPREGRYCVHLDRDLPEVVLVR